MYYREIDKIKAVIARNAPLTESEVIRHIIAEDAGAEEKQAMVTGELYYRGRHDILNRKKKEGMSANNRVLHVFHRLMVDQKAAYIVGQPMTWTTGKENADTVISEYLGQGWDRMLKSLVIHASNKGVEWLHPYWTPTGEFRYTRIPAEQVIPIYDQQFE